MKQMFRILFAVTCTVFGLSIAALLGYMVIQQMGNREYQGLRGIAVTVRTGSGKGSEKQEKTKNNCVQAGDLENPPALLIDFESLKSVNGDTAAWIDFPGQDISYPIVHGEDNTYYLRRTFEGRRNSMGCIFADARNQGLVEDDNTIIYGHNMRNGSMFGTLKNYMEQSHYEQFPYFDLYTEDAVYRCQITACCRIRAKGENYPISFSADLERAGFIQDMKKATPYPLDGADASILELGRVNSEVPLVMLSTCTGKQHQYRFVLLAQAVEVIP